MARPPVPSPCQGVCDLDYQRLACKTCGRTTQEIEEWSRADQERRLEINRNAYLRRTGDGHRCTMTHRKS
ncbi:MAG: DUF1289 domain-containing protein [Myxococcota bacterium]|nr:DUF1289 domain-containing protein [Myxococcota bacterium]